MKLFGPKIIVPSLEEVVEVENAQPMENTGILDQNGNPIYRDNIGHAVLEPSHLGMEKSHLRLHDEPIVEDNYQGNGSRIVPLLMGAGKVAAGIAMVALPAYMLLGHTSNAQASTLGNPLNYVPNSSTPVMGGWVTGLQPTEVLTDYEGTVDHTATLVTPSGNIQWNWAASSNQGNLYFFKGRSLSPLYSIQTGRSNALGLTFKSDEDISVSVGNAVYEGNVKNGVWRPTQSILTNCPSDIQGISWDPDIGKYLGVTKSNSGIKFGYNGTTETVNLGNNWNSVDVLRFKPGVFDSNLITTAQNTTASKQYNNGNALENWKLTEFEPGFPITGMGFNKDGVIIGQGNWVDFHDRIGVQDYMIAAPDPGTLLFFVAGASLLSHKYRNHTK